MNRTNPQPPEASAPLTRVVHWHDPSATRRAAAAIDGIELVRGQIDGVYPLPPAAHLLNLSVRQVALGRVRFGYRPDPSHAGETGVVPGGIVSAVLETALRSAARSTLPAGLTLRTVELNVHLVRDLPLNAGGLVLDGRVVHGGRRLLTADARLQGPCGTLYAHGSATLTVQPQPDPGDVE